MDNLQFFVVFYEEITYKLFLSQIILLSRCSAVTKMRYFFRQKIICLSSKNTNIVERHCGCEIENGIHITCLLIRGWILF